MAIIRLEKKEMMHKTLEACANRRCLQLAQLVYIFGDTHIYRVDVASIIAAYVVACIVAAPDHAYSTYSVVALAAVVVVAATAAATPTAHVAASHVDVALTNPW